MRAKLWIALALAGQPLRAEWKPLNAPEGYFITGLAVSGSTAYAATRGGIFRATVTGGVWSPLPGLLDTLPAHEFSSPFAADTGGCFAGYADGLFRFDAATDAWTDISAGLSDSAVTALIRNGDTLWAGLRNGGLFRSGDRGATWRGTAAAPGAGEILSLLAQGDSLWVGGRSGLFLSPDRGVRWQAAHKGLKDSVVLGIAAGAKAVFARTDSALYRTQDGGAHWTRIDPPGQAGVFFGLDAVGDRLFATTRARGFRSSDAGVTWTADRAEFNQNGVRARTRVLAWGDDLIASSYFGVTRSRDAGKTWEYANTGIAASGFTCLIFTGKGRLLAGAFAHQYQSPDSGRSWSPLPPIGASRVSVSFASLQGRLFSGTYEGLYRSLDQGASWKHVEISPWFGRPYAFAMLDGVWYATGEEYGAYRSFDSGATWKQIDVGLKRESIRSLTVCDGILYAAGDGQAYAWSPEKSEWIATGMSSVRKTTSLASMGPYLLLGSATNGVYRSTDGGALWKPSATGLPDTSVLGLWAVGGDLFAGTGKGLALSTDSGRTWSPVNAGLPELPVSAFLAAGEDLYLGLKYRGLWKTTRSALAPAKISKPR